MIKNYKAWVLIDQKIGSNNQAIALAEEIQIPYKELKLTYNFLARLPSIFLPKSFMQISSPNIIDLLEKETPDLVISASRKSALVAATIKSKKPHIKTIHILKPDISFRNFDLVIVPQHDKNITSKYKNVFQIIGALNNIKNRLENYSEELNQHYADLINTSFTTILIGGNTKSFSFTRKTAEDFYHAVLNIAEQDNSKFFVTYSRRTPEIVKDVFNQLKDHGHKIYDPLTSDPNPYPYIMSKSKFVISTCDSISMLSEIASIGKPLYIYIPENFNSKKHLAFVYQLSDLGMAKIIDQGTDFLQEYNYTNLSETRKAGEYVLSSILGVK